MAALTGRRPATKRTTCVTPSSPARPREPLAGSFTPIRCAPPARAAAASETDRTLTRSWVMPSSFRGHGEEAHPSRKRSKGKYDRVGKCEAVDHRPLKPGGVCEMAGMVGGQ